MHDHDLDLIAAYADGSLDRNVSEAERLVATCDTCRAEFERQREVKELLRSLPTVTLTDIERHRLHSELRRELTPSSALMTTARPSRRAPWWAGIAAVAAGLLVVVVGTGVVLRMGSLASGGGVESQLASPDTATSAASAETSTTAAALQEFAPTEEGAVPPPGADLEASTTSAASPPAAPDLGEVSMTEIEAALASRASLQEESVEPSRRPYETILSCVDHVDGDILAAVTASVDGVDVEAFLVARHGDTEVVVLTSSDCTPFAG